MKHTPTDYWNRKVLEFIQPYFRDGQKLFRIATGFFTISGFDLLKEELKNGRVELLVGFDEATRERVKQSLIADIIYHLRTWEGDNRRNAVLALVDKLKKRRFRLIEQHHEQEIDARLRKQDHGKVYIIDDSIVITGSANFTSAGLLRNVEGIKVIDEKVSVNYWVSQFKAYWQDKNTVDLTQELLEALLAWLKLYSPFEVYLKALSILISDKEVPPPSKAYKMPVQYQMVVIRRVLNQISKWNGAMLVASTGLGKTVMATHIAYRLHREGLIYKVMVFAPKATLGNWRLDMENAGIACTPLVRNLLDDPRKKDGKYKELHDALGRVDERTLIIIDESHYYKNSLRAKDSKRRHSFQRLSKAANEVGAKILLLTATPYAKGVEDINNQLALLPKNAPLDYRTTKGQEVMSGIRDEDVEPTKWKVLDTDNFFQDFIELPVTTVISTSAVARDFATRVQEGDYILFGKQKRWIPKIEIKKVKVPVIFEQLIGDALQRDIFRHKAKSFTDRYGQWRRSETIVENHLITSWVSSPLALQDVIDNILADKYKVKWKKPHDQEAVLMPIREQLKAITWKEDKKFQTLHLLLEQARQDGRKVIVFTERHATGVYLQESLNKAMPTLRVANVSKRVDGTYDLKDFENEVQPLIAGFAPIANRELAATYEDEGKKIKSYDVFITTDAFSTGVNLQDASMVISYDLAWTPDVIIQRAGRVLRLWQEPRLVSLFVFVGDFQADLHRKGETAKLEKRLRDLATRGENAQKFSEIPIIPTVDEARFESLGDLSKVEIEDLGKIDLSEIEEFPGQSSFLRHLTVLKQNMVQAKRLPDDIVSAKVYQGKKRKLFLLLKHEDLFYPILYDIDTETIESTTEDSLLDLIRCDPKTPTAEKADINFIDLQAQKCRNMWLENQSTRIDGSKVERICAMYLLPNNEAISLGEFLQTQWTLS